MAALHVQSPCSNRPAGASPCEQSLQSTPCARLKGRGLMQHPWMMSRESQKSPGQVTDGHHQLLLKSPPNSCVLR